MTGLEKVCFWLMAALPWLQAGVYSYGPRTTNKQAVLVVSASEYSVASDGHRGWTPKDH